MPSYAAYKSYRDIRTTNDAAREKGGREFIGMSAPKSDDPNQMWVATNNIRTQVNDPHSGSRYNTLPVWTKINVPGTAEKKQEAKPSTPAPTSKSQQDNATPKQLTDRREALERAQKFQAESAQVPKTPYPTDTMSPRFYDGLNDYGRAYVRDYVEGQLPVDARKAELGVEENAYFGNRALQQIDPKRMAVSKPTTFDDTIAQLERYKKLIG